MESWIAAQGGLTMLGVALAKYGLGIFSVLSIMVIVERAYVLRRLRRHEENDYRALKDALVKQQADAVRTYAMAGLSPSAAALQAGLENERGSDERIKDAIAQEVEVQIAALQHNLPILATVASTAPYVGLFGTVLGILGAFHVIAATGQTGASVVAGGISEALITTALGLGVAIPSVIAYNYFSGRVNALGLKIETHAVDLTARLLDLQTALAGGGPVESR